MKNKKGLLWSSLVLLTVLALTLALTLTLSGCGGGGGSSNGGGGGSSNGGGGGNGTPIDFDPTDYENTTWKSGDGIPKAITLTIGEVISTEGAAALYTGEVACEVFEEGSIELTEDNDDILGNFIMISGTSVGGTTIIGFHVRTREEYVHELWGETSNEVNFDAFMESSDTLSVLTMHIHDDNTLLEFDFDSEEDDYYLYFDKE